jgi:hypothetical protein
LDVRHALYDLGEPDFSCRHVVASHPNLVGAVLDDCDYVLPSVVPAVCCECPLAVVRVVPLGTVRLIVGDGLGVLGGGVGPERVEGVLAAGGPL